ncbi:hypothetical protein [Anatilimnocola floriformis]|uniref:hypothetical protein n=1 Tax=Anatilimnocola floriformis TaxID=2948575 RepID=UPI0020C30C76|nr:hypothetical protein [Anatilimnocola floriformis]
MSANHWQGITRTFAAAVAIFLIGAVSPIAVWGQGAPDWRKLDFAKGRKLTKIRVVVQDMGFAASPKIKADFSIDQPEILELLQSALADSHMPVPRSEGGFAGALPKMRIEAVTNQDRFAIQVFERSFNLNDKSESYDSDRVFWSPGLACLLEVLLEKNSEIRLPPVEVSALAGERHIAGDLKQFREKIAKVPALQDKP